VIVLHPAMKVSRSVALVTTVKIANRFSSRSDSLRIYLCVIVK
jgi:hypothetical protein